MIFIKEHEIPVPHGVLFAKCWTPSLTHGSTIVLLHDSLGCTALWRNFPEELAKSTRRKVICYDRLGFGRSSAHPAKLLPTFVVSEHEGDFKSVCDYFSLSRYTVIGHSIGGGMAISCASRQPESCESLITICAQAFVDSRIIKGIRDAMKFFQNREQFQRLERYHGAKTDWVLSAWIDTWQSDSFKHWNLDRLLPDVRCPFLCLHGDLDEYGSIEHPQRLVSLAGPDSRMVILPGLGHVPHREKPEKVIELIVGFLNSSA